MFDTVGVRGESTCDFLRKPLEGVPLKDLSSSQANDPSHASSAGAQHAPPRPPRFPSGVVKPIDSSASTRVVSMSRDRSSMHMVGMAYPCTEVCGWCFTGVDGEDAGVRYGVAVFGVAKKPGSRWGTQWKLCSDACIGI